MQADWRQTCSMRCHAAMGIHRIQIGAAQPAAAMTASCDAAILLSEQVKETEQRILDFLYPQAHTVDLADLREPALLDELKALQRSASEFENGSQKAQVSSPETSCTKLTAKRT